MAKTNKTETIEKQFNSLETDMGNFFNEIGSLFSKQMNFKFEVW